MVFSGTLHAPGPARVKVAAHDIAEIQLTRVNSLWRLPTVAADAAVEGCNGSDIHFEEVIVTGSRARLDTQSGAGLPKSVSGIHKLSSPR